MELILDNRNTTVLKCTKIRVSKFEASILELIDNIRYGTIFNVENIDVEMVTTRDVSPRRMELINFMRDGCPWIDEMVVHDGEVSYINVAGLFPCRHVRKVKF